MTVALVHGNPETSAVWDTLRVALGRDDVVCLSPRGSGRRSRRGGGPRSRTTATG